jgi:hypothetical protein
MRSFFTFIIALAGITQLSAEQRSDKIVIQGNPAGNQTIQAVHMSNIPITIADAAITLQQPGSSMLLECPLNTKAVATIT